MSTTYGFDTGLIGGLVLRRWPPMHIPEAMPVPLGTDLNQNCEELRRDVERQWTEVRARYAGETTSGQLHRAGNGHNGENENGHPNGSLSDHAK
ncbi:unnamed protein product [Penicillium palitans]